MFEQEGKSGWGTFRLGDICRPKQWPTISLMQFKSTGYPVYGANGQIGHFNDYTHEAATVAVTCRGATCGNIHVTVPRSYITGNAMALDNLDPSVAEVAFLANVLRHRGLGDCVTGSAQPQIIGGELRRVAIELPPLA